MNDQKYPIISIVRAAASDKPVVANLVQLYLYDMTADLPFPVGRDGKFEYDYLDRFWQHPYLFFEGGELAGFALVIDTCPVTLAAPCFFMAEFCVLKAYRGKGVGTAAFKDILRRHPGRWHIGVIDANRRANAFWSRIMAAYDATTSSHPFDGENWLIYDFGSVA